MGKGLCEAIEQVSRKVHETIITPPGSKNVTEWCKRPDCWDAVRHLQIYLPVSLQNELLFTESEKSTSHNGSTATSAHEDLQLATRIAEIPADVWFQLASWARETRNLGAGQRRFASRLGMARRKNAPLSVEDTKQASLLLREALKLGFKPEVSMSRVN